MIVDKEGCYYNETSKDFWGTMKVIGDEIIANGRVVKGLHWAGGGTMSNKYSHPAFGQDVRVFLNKVTGTKDFTNA